MFTSQVQTSTLAVSEWMVEFEELQPVGHAATGDGQGPLQVQTVY